MFITRQVFFAPRFGSHLQLKVLLLKLFVFIGVAVRELIDLDAILLDLLSDLRGQHVIGCEGLGIAMDKNTRMASRNFTIGSTDDGLALIFFFLTSLGVSVSALARMGTMLTFSCRAFMNSTSRGRRLEGKQKTHQIVRFTKQLQDDFLLQTMPVTSIYSGGNAVPSKCAPKYIHLYFICLINPLFRMNRH